MSIKNYQGKNCDERIIKKNILKFDNCDRQRSQEKSALKSGCANGGEKFHRNFLVAATRSEYKQNNSFEERLKNLTNLRS